MNLTTVSPCTLVAAAWDVSFLFKINLDEAPMRLLIVCMPFSLTDCAKRWWNVISLLFGPKIAVGIVSQLTTVVAHYHSQSRSCFTIWILICSYAPVLVRRTLQHTMLNLLTWMALDVKLCSKILKYQSTLRLVSLNKILKLSQTFLLLSCIILKFMLLE